MKRISSLTLQMLGGGGIGFMWPRGYFAFLLLFGAMIIIGIALNEE